MNKKERKPRKDFAQRLAEKLRNIGDVETGALSDDSARWVCLKMGKLSVNFTFDMKGEQIDRVGFYEEVWQMVDERQIFSFDKPKPKNKEQS